jgi:hypothetical protein
MKDRVTLTTREPKRVLVLQRMERGAMTAVKAAVVLEVSVRQVRRLLVAYRQEGVAALATAIGVGGARAGGRRGHNRSEHAVTPTCWRRT